MCGYFNEKKGFPIGVEAFGRVAKDHPDVQLHIVGDGPQRADIHSAVRNQGLENRVTFFGLVDGPEYLRCLSECEVLLHPSITAADGDTEGGSPVVIIEAMASGIPVVSSLHADIPVVAPAGECALLAPEGDVESLAEALHALLSDETLRRRMGNAGRRHVAEHHDAETQARSLESLYDEVSR
jgi:colanic acid/amylovoran biosynthesis glycosyltransferase